MLARRETLVVGCDFSKGAMSALGLAVAWARSSGARLEVAHVAPPGLDGRAYAALAAHLRELVDEAGGADLETPPATLVTRGEPSSVLRAIAAKAAGWIVVGAHGNDAVLQRLAGTVAAQLAADAAVPVVVTPPRWTPPSGRGVAGPFSRVLVGLSGGTRDASLLEDAAVLARSASASLVAGHSVEVEGETGYPAAVRDDLRRRAMSRSIESQRALAALVAETLPFELASLGEVPVHVTCQGPAWRDLAGLAASQGAELLVVGAGPTAVRLVAVAPCALLVVPRS